MGFKLSKKIAITELDAGTIIKYSNEGMLTKQDELDIVHSYVYKLNKYKLNNPTVGDVLIDAAIKSCFVDDARLVNVILTIVDNKDKLNKDNIVQYRKHIESLLSVSFSDVINIDTFNFDIDIANKEEVLKTSLEELAAIMLEVYGITNTIHIINRFI